MHVCVSPWPCLCPDTRALVLSFCLSAWQIVKNGIEDFYEDGGWAIFLADEEPEDEEEEEGM